MIAETSPPRALNSAMRFGAIANPTSYDWYPRWAMSAERAGFDVLACGDSQSLWGDPFVTLAAASSATTRSQLAVTVSNPRTRHPAAVAGALATLHQLSGGRVVLGLGSGDSALRNIGLPPATVDEVGEFAQCVKRLCATGKATWKDAQVELRWSRFDLPIWIAAEGPRMQHLAGRIADGVLLSNSLEATALAKAMANVTQGAESVGRSVDDVEVWLMTAMCIAESRSAGIHRLRALLAGTANHVYRFRIEGKGVPDELHDPIRELQRRYDSRHHASPATAEHNARLVQELGLVDFLAARSVVAGTPSECARRFKTLASEGAKNFLIHSQANEPLEFVEAFATVSATLRPDHRGGQS